MEDDLYDANPYREKDAEALRQMIAKQYMAIAGMLRAFPEPIRVPVDPREFVDGEKILTAFYLAREAVTASRTPVPFRTAIATVMLNWITATELASMITARGST